MPQEMLAMLGGGQLGRFFVMAAHDMGFKVSVLDPDKNSPAGKIADIHICKKYDDKSALDEIIETCSAATTEFENIPAESLDYLGKQIQVYPKAKSVHIVQNRIREKKFLLKNLIPVGLFFEIESEVDLNKVSQDVFPAIIKIAEFGYDGKGQKKVKSQKEALSAFNEFDKRPCVLEKQVKLDKEVSVILARSHDGVIVTHPVAENIHINGILDTTIAPARIDQLMEKNITDLAKMIAFKLDFIGVMAVEFFISGNEIFVNEIAPRPHNSGHYSLDACYVSQFSQQVRTLAEMPLGNSINHSKAIMVNLLGELWDQSESHQPKWQEALSVENFQLHLYGKKDPRLGRKMGHITFTTQQEITEELILDVRQIKENLK